MERFSLFMDLLIVRCLEGSVVPAPFVDASGKFFSQFDPAKVCVGDTVTLNEKIRLSMDTMTDSEGHLWLPLFLSMDDLEKGETGNVTAPVAILDIFKAGLIRDDLEGVVVNPFGIPFTFGKNMIGHLIKRVEELAEEIENNGGVL